MAEILLAGVPPLGAFPAIPRPLRWVLGLQSRLLDAQLRDVARTVPRTQHLSTPTPTPKGFASDGFHPNKATYDAWGRFLAVRWAGSTGAIEEAECRDQLSDLYDASRQLIRINFSLKRAAVVHLASTLALLLLISSCVPPPGSAWRRLSEDDDGLQRRYLEYIPDSLRAKSTVPLIVVLHGAFSTPVQTKSYTGFDTIADENNAIVMYPEGIGLGGILHHWNAGFCCGFAHDRGVRDVEFIRAAIDDAAERHPIDMARLYIVGISNGGMLAFSFASDYPEYATAIAVVAGAASGRLLSEPQLSLPNHDVRPVSVLTIHGTADTTVPYLGGQSMRHGSMFFTSARESAALWARNNKCPRAPLVTNPLKGVVRLHWSDCEENSDVMLYALDGLGHYWPNNSPANQPSFPGFNATRVIWDFFKNKTRTPQPSHQPHLK